MDSRRWMVVALVALCVAAAARLLLQVAVMPPYAGLDELFHVARLAFVAREGRQPDDREKSVPPYLASSIYESPKGLPPNRPAVLPAFALAGARWPQIADGVWRVRGDVPLPPEELHPYFEANYEAQHPAPYYALHAPLATLGPRTAAGELRTWRRASVFFALVTVLATAFIGVRCFGVPGLLAAALLASIPTWQTLVARAGNDAMSCAALALAVAVTVAAPQRWAGWVAEGVAWGLAAAIKLYSWPLVPLLVLFWWKQRASRGRIAIVTILLGIAAFVTMSELRGRTSSSLGLFAFDQVARTGTAVPIDVAGIAKITVATGIWMPGQHGNALTPAGMALYALPIVALLAAGLLAAKRLERHPRVPYWFMGVAIGLFAFAQLVTMAAYLRHAMASGLSLPAGGKEGWYYFTMAPLLAGVGVAAAVRGLAARSPFLLSAFVALVVGWDVRISEGALFRDYAGLSWPTRPSLLFRWGSPSVAPGDLYERLALVSIEPLVAAAPWLRVIQVAGIALLTWIVIVTARDGVSAGAR